MKEIPLPLTGVGDLETALFPLQLMNEKLNIQAKRKSVCFNLIIFCFL